LHQGDGKPGSVALPASNSVELSRGGETRRIQTVDMGFRQRRAKFEIGAD